MESVLFLLVLPVFILLLLRKHRGIGRAIRPLPGPSGLPIIGNLHQYFYYKSVIHQYLWQLSQKYGPLMFIRLGSVPTLIVSSAKMAKEILNTHDLEFSSRPTLIGQKRLSYNQLDLAFSPYNDYWRQMRKICVIHLFCSKRVQSFRFIREEEVSKMIKRISNLVASSEDSKLITNLSKTTMSLTGNIICGVAFGKRYKDEGLDSNRFINLLTEAQAMLAGFFFSDYFPLMGWVDRVTGMMDRLEKNFKDLDLFYQELIDEHLNPKRPKSMQEDVIDILLQLRNDKFTSIDLSLDHIKAILMNIFVAGTDTSAATIVWAMTALIKRPTILKKVQIEVRDLIGKKGMVDEDDIQKLPYLRALIKETFRLYPPAPLLAPRETIQKCVIDGYEIQSKTLVYVNAWAIARDPEVWKNPEVFSLEKFLENDNIDFKGNDFQFIPFGAGRRGCPGMNLGVAIVELALANLLYAFDWELPIGMKKEDVDSDVRPGLTMYKKNDLCLVAKNHQF
ncbi:unspecific monooxygenase [Sarracenia purpurea var. burkii]